MPSYQVIARPDLFVFEVRDEEGHSAIVKTEPTLDESRTLQQLSQAKLPAGTENIGFPRFISSDATGLPEEIPTHKGVLIMSKMEGIPLHHWQKPIARADWEALRTAIAALNAQGIHHGDLKEDHLWMRTDEAGRTHIDIIDWGGQKYGPRTKDNDINRLNEAEELTVKRGLLIADQSRLAPAEGRNWRDTIQRGDFELE